MTHAMSDGLNLDCDEVFDTDDLAQFEELEEDDIEALQDFFDRFPKLEMLLSKTSGFHFRCKDCVLMIDEALRAIRDSLATYKETAYGLSINIEDVTTRFNAQSEEDDNANIEEPWRVIFGSGVGHLLDVSVSLEAPVFSDDITKLRFDQMDKYFIGLNPLLMLKQINAQVAAQSMVLERVDQISNDNFIKFGFELFADVFAEYRRRFDESPFLYMFAYNVIILRRHFVLLRKFMLALIVKNYQQLVSEDVRKMRKFLYLTMHSRIKQCHQPLEPILEHQSNVVTTETLNEGYLSVVGDVYEKKARKMKRQTLQMKAQNRVFLNGESRDIITQKMRHIYVEEHEHDGTIMSQYYNERVRTAVHSTAIDNAMLKSDASTYAFPLRSDLSQR